MPMRKAALPASGQKKGRKRREGGRERESRKRKERGEKKENIGEVQSLLAPNRQPRRMVWLEWCSKVNCSSETNSWTLSDPKRLYFFVNASQNHSEMPLHTH